MSSSVEEAAAAAADGWVWGWAAKVRERAEGRRRVRFVVEEKRVEREEEEEVRILVALKAFISPSPAEERESGTKRYATGNEVGALVVLIRGFFICFFLPVGKHEHQTPGRSRPGQVKSSRIIGHPQIVFIHRT